MAREPTGARVIVFIDEVDSLCISQREGEDDLSCRVKTEFLTQMDGVGTKEGGVLVLGATNVPWELDTAIRHRFEKRVYIPLPGPDARSSMVRIHLGDTSNNLSNSDFRRLGRETAGASGSDIKVLIKEALLEPLRLCREAYLVTCITFPNCEFYPQKSSSDPPGKIFNCRRCGARQMQLWDVPLEKLKAPDVSVEDFQRVLRHFSVCACVAIVVVVWLIISTLLLSILPHLHLLLLSTHLPLLLSLLLLR